MVKSMLFCKGKGTLCFGGSGNFCSVLGLLEELISPFPKEEIRLFASPDGLWLIGEFSFFWGFKEKKEFKRLKIPNLSILLAPIKEKIVKNNCKSFRYKV